MRRTALLAAVLIPAAIACGPPSLDSVEPTHGVTRVALEDNRFKPRVIQVAPGTTITWDWNDGSKQHDVVGDDFASEVQSSGSFEHTFTTPGTFDYRCTLHSNMTGRVIVEEN